MTLATGTAYSFLSSRPSGGILSFWLYLSVFPSVLSQHKISETAHQFFSDFFAWRYRVIKYKKWWSSITKKFVHDMPPQKVSKMPQKWGFGGLDKNLIYSCALFKLEYEYANNLLTFCKNKCLEKILVLELWSKNLYTNQNAGFSKLQYLTNESMYKVQSLCVIWRQWKQQIYFVMLTGCG